MDAGHIVFNEFDVRSVMEASESMEMARRYREGDGVEKDPARAAGILGELSDSGYAPAAASLGYMHLVGEGIPKDMCQAEHYLTIAADSGDAGSMCNLGVMLAESDPGRALEWFRRAAEAGSLSAMRNVAAMDQENAIAWLQRAADLGDIDSIVILAAKYRNGDGVPVDKARAAELYRIAADKGDMEAQYDLAFMLDSAEGIPEDRAEAERYFILSADQGDTDACLCIGGILYERGEFDRAESYFLSAAMKEDVKAQYNLGLLYMEGEHADIGKAREWFEAAAEQGFVLAFTMLGSMDLDAGDMGSAASRFKVAAEAGEPTAQYNYGALGLSGQISMPFEEAAGWVSKSAQQGFQPALEVLMRLNAQGRSCEGNPLCNRLPRCACPLSHSPRRRLQPHRCHWGCRPRRGRPPSRASGCACISGWGPDAVCGAPWIRGRLSHRRCSATRPSPAGSLSCIPASRRPRP